MLVIYFFNDLTLSYFFLINKICLGHNRYIYTHLTKVSGQKKNDQINCQTSNAHCNTTVDLNCMQFFLLYYAYLQLSEHSFFLLKFLSRSLGNFILIKLIIKLQYNRQSLMPSVSIGIDDGCRLSYTDLQLET